MSRQRMGPFLQQCRWLCQDGAAVGRFDAAPAAGRGNAGDFLNWTRRKGKQCQSAVSGSFSMSIFFTVVTFWMKIFLITI
jgi:hypothetical protein